MENWDQSNERQMPQISDTWTMMIPLDHVDRCRAVMAQHLQFNRGARRTKKRREKKLLQSHMDANNPQCAFVLSFVHAALIAALLKGTRPKEEKQRAC